MTNLRLHLGAGLLGLALVSGCSTNNQAPDVTGSIQDSLKQQGLGDVSVSQDRDKAVVTLKGNVAADADKMRAEAIAKSMAAGQVVANEIAVLPPGQSSDAKTINKDLDQAIGKNLDAALTKNGLHDAVKYDVNQGVVTLTGTVNSQATRAEAQEIAARIPNVAQVVNKIDVKNERASTTR